MSPFIDVRDAKAYLNRTGASTSKDDELTRVVEAACTMIEDVKGHVVPVDVTETLQAASVLVSRPLLYAGWEHLVVLNETPVLAVTAVTRLNGDGTSEAVAARDTAGGVPFGWWQTDSVVHVPFWSGREGGYSVTYRAGVDPLPPNYRLAALELVAHLWRANQENNSLGAPKFGADDQDWMRGVGTTYAMPFRVRELLGIYGKTVPGSGLVIA